MLNIVKNCIEHTAPSGWVRVQCIDNPLHVRVEVTDNGGGIHPEDLPHIFERFYRGKDAKPDSAGIGLAMARAVIPVSYTHLDVYKRQVHEWCPAWPCG